jgi:hypothetical protein
VNAGLRIEHERLAARLGVRRLRAKQGCGERNANTCGFRDSVAEAHIRRVVDVATHRALFYVDETALPYPGGKL